MDDRPDRVDTNWELVPKHGLAYERSSLFPKRRLPELDSGANQSAGKAYKPRCFSQQYAF
ncbi:MAG TPA: hypothetical protein VKA34_09890 [Balneolales bacterium]|nr:hypothetical protein [Balneolales bacterium]